MYTIIAIIISVLLAVALGVSVYYNIQSLKFFNLIEVQLENALDNLENHHKIIKDILEIPVMSDNVYVRQVIKSIQDTHNSIVVVYKNLYNLFQPENNDKKDV